MLVRAFNWCCKNSAELTILGTCATMYFVSWAYAESKEMVEANQVVATEIIERLGINTTAENLSMQEILDRLHELNVDVRKGR